eukprot:gene7181-11493_t
MNKRETKLFEEQERQGFQHMQISNLLNDLFPVSNEIEQEEEPKTDFFQRYTESDLIYKLFPKPAITFPFKKPSSEDFVDDKYDRKQREEVLSFFQEILKKK